MATEIVIDTLDGAHRQQVRAELWAAWRTARRGAAILTGFSGTGKTDRIVRALIARARTDGIPAVHIDVPLYPTDLDQELLGQLTEEVEFNNYGALADRLKDQPNFTTALAAVLRGDVLVVIDEFQRLLDPTARPIEPLGGKLRRFAAPRPDQGCIWLVSNRLVDPEWAEPFHLADLQPPEQVADALKIVAEGFGSETIGERLPAARQTEVVRRLGFNPRVLRMLGTLLRLYSLEELLGPPALAPESPPDPRLIDDTERTLLAKAREGLSPPASVALRNLSILSEAVTWLFVEAMIRHLGDPRALIRDLRERYLLEVDSNRYRVHPVVREVEVPHLRLDTEVWRGAQRRAGEWYAKPLVATGGPHIGDAAIAIALAGARYHLTEAQAIESLQTVIYAVGDYITRRYHWGAPRPVSAGEREACIALLELFLEQPGPPSAEFQLAKALRERGAPGDLEKALTHAERSTAGQDFADPWMLWAQLSRDVGGIAAGVTAVKLAIERVAPKNNLYRLYVFLGACLEHLGRTMEAVDALLEGAEIVKGSRREGRLIEAAAFVAAAEATEETLRRVRDWAGTREGFDPQLMLCETLLLERQGRWRDAALAARLARDRYSQYIHFALHEAMGWLGAGEPAFAQSALDRFPGGLRYNLRDSLVWLAAFVSLNGGDSSRASDLLSTYLGTAAPTTADGIRAALLREWDHRVAKYGEAIPSLNFPILPPEITGMQSDTMRPQYGPPVLPQHQAQIPRPTASTDKKLRILAVATEWQSGQGGLSTLNRQLCCALAAADTDVCCVVIHPSEDERQAAQAARVTLIEAPSTPGMVDQSAGLARKPALPPGFVPDVIIGHGRVTGPAALILKKDHFSEARLLHFIHMAPDEIEWFKLDRRDDAGARAEERTEIELELGRAAALVVAIGPRLYQRALNDFHPYDTPTPVRLDPGFDAENEAERKPPPGVPLKVLVLGRLEDYHLKGLDLAAGAVGLAASRRGSTADPIELVVRGAPKGESDKVHIAVKKWAENHALSVVVRPYSAETERLSADIQRASLVLMPSRTEGFGLVGLESIVAGTPVLVSDQSGLGALLHEALEREQASRFVVAISGDDEQDKDVWGRAIEAVLRDREAAFRRAAELRTQLGSQKTWAAAIAGLLAELDYDRNKRRT